jgi:hypothetical protein
MCCLHLCNLFFVPLTQINLRKCFYVINYLSCPYFIKYSYYIDLSLNSWDKSYIIVNYAAFTIIRLYLVGVPFWGWNEILEAGYFVKKTGLCDSQFWCLKYLNSMIIT